MNENLNLVEILKDCQTGTKFYTSVWGEVSFRKLLKDKIYTISIDTCIGNTGLTKEGYYLPINDAECIIFPSKEQRDWSKFTAPWCNLEKQSEDKKEINNFDVLPGLYKCIHRMFDGTPDGRLLFEIGNVYKCLSKHDRAEFEVSYGHSVYLEDPVVCKYFIPFESKGEQASLQTNERTWLYLVSDVLTWKDGIEQYLDDPSVQELAKRLCNKYAQKLYIPSNTGKNEPKSADKIEPRFKVDDWVVDNCGYVWKIEGRLNQFYILDGVEGGESRPTIDWVDKTFHLWTIEDAKDSDILACKEEILLFKSYSVQERISLYCWYNGQTNNFHSKEEIDISLNKRHKIFPATKEQRDTFMKAMNDAGYEWDEEKKELKKK